MDQDVDGDGAINLSTSQRPSAATTPNDGIQDEDVEQVSRSPWRSLQIDPRNGEARDKPLFQIGNVPLFPLRRAVVGR